MKNFLNSVGNFLLAVGEARYASWLARQGVAPQGIYTYTQELL